VSQLHDALADDVGQGTAVDEHTAQLVDAAMTYSEKKIIA
jgi:hypothetical protein